VALSFPDGGIPRVITFGGQGSHQRRALVPYADDPGTGWRWVAMDSRFRDGFVGAMSQNAIEVEWIADDFPIRLRQLATLLGIELSAGAGPILAAAVELIQGR
jgi:hypothetical protein